MSNDTAPRHVITQLLPVEALRKLNALAQRLQREEIFRTHLQERAWLVLPACIFLTFMILGVCIALVVGASFILEPTTRWAKVALFTGGLLLWLVSTLFAIYRYFLFLEQEALRLHELD